MFEAGQASKAGPSKARPDPPPGSGPMAAARVTLGRLTRGASSRGCGRCACPPQSPRWMPSASRRRSWLPGADLVCDGALGGQCLKQSRSQLWSSLVPTLGPKSLAERHACHTSGPRLGGMRGAQPQRRRKAPLLAMAADAAAPQAWEVRQPPARAQRSAERPALSPARSPSPIDMSAASPGRRHGFVPRGRSGAGGSPGVPVARGLQPSAPAPTPAAVLDRGDSPPRVPDGAFGDADDDEDWPSAEDDEEAEDWGPVPTRPLDLSPGRTQAAPGRGAGRAGPAPGPEDEGFEDGIGYGDDEDYGFASPAEGFADDRSAPGRGEIDGPGGRRSGAGTGAAPGAADARGAPGRAGADSGALGRAGSRGAGSSRGAGQSRPQQRQLSRQSQPRQQSRQRQQNHRRTAGSASGVRRAPPSSASADPGAAAAAVASRGSAAPGPPPSSAGAGAAASGRRGHSQPSLEFSRRARAVDYTPKTLEQYRAAQPADGRYVELGTLGPDLSTEELSRKHAQRRRVREYSKRVARAVKAPVAPRPAPQAEERHRAAERRAEPSARERAMQFARSRVPQPKTRSPAAAAGPGHTSGGGGGSGNGGGGSGGGIGGGRSGGGGGGGAAGPSPLEALEAEHDRLAARVAGIRRLV